MPEDFGQTPIFGQTMVALDHDFARGAASRSADFFPSKSTIIKSDNSSAIKLLLTLIQIILTKL